MDNAQVLNNLNAIELELAEHRAFGDVPYIHKHLHLCFERGLGKLSGDLPVAGQLLDALSRAGDHARYRVIGDTVVRCAITHALTRFETGDAWCLPLEECEEVFRATLRHLEEGHSGGPLETGVTPVARLGPEPFHGWIWTEEHSGDVFGRSFRHVIEDNHGRPLCTPDADELNMLAKGAELLGVLLPALSSSALAHTHVVAVFARDGKSAGRGSSSQFNIGGTIFLTRNGLKDPWWAAEHLLHESLHQKMYDFRRGHTLLNPDFARDDAPRVCSLWNEPSKEYNWDTHRAIAAFHVYVHLALLSAVAERREPTLAERYGRLEGMAGSQTAIERAYYLGEQIKKLCWQELGLAGHVFIDWLCAVLDTLLDCLDVSPPPENSSLHLLLDRYRREARKVEIVLWEANSANGNGGTKADFPLQLTDLIKEEAKSVRSLLSTVDGADGLNRFDDAMAQYKDEELGAKFADVRRLISKTLLNMSPDGYRLKSYSLGPEAPDEIVRQMVESSSQRLDMMLAS